VDGGVTTGPCVQKCRDILMRDRFHAERSPA
jgi:hypothetical protein